MTTSPRFWNRVAKKYAARPIEDEDAYRHKLALTQEHLTPDMEVLEFGCGTGGTALLHAPHVRHITAIDFSDRMIEFARARAAETDVENVSFRVAAIEDVDPADGRYDAVLGLSILHLLEDPDAVLARVRRLLRPGGLFVSSTVCVGDMKGIARIILPIGTALRIFPLVHRFTARKLLARLVAAGFSVEREWRPGPDKALFVIARAPG